jgi:hypothetical protein
MDGAPLGPESAGAGSAAGEAEAGASAAAPSGVEFGLAQGEAELEVCVWGGGAHRPCGVLGGQGR